MFVYYVLFYVYTKQGSFRLIHALTETACNINQILKLYREPGP